MGLPDGQKAVVNNVYLPPTASLRRRHIEEQSARDAVADVVTAMPAASYTLTCGDFNTRTGTRAPCIHDLQLHRESQDTTVCPRAGWLVDLCELAGQHIINGSNQQAPAPFTSTNINGQGRAVVDYILSNTASHVINYDAIVLEQYSDHVLLHMVLQVAVQPPRPPAATPNTTAATPNATAATTYRWDVGATVQNQV